MKKFMSCLALAISVATAHAQVAPSVPAASQITGVSGNGHTLATTSGSLTSGHGPVFDANGNIVDSGAAPGGSVTTSSVQSAISGQTIAPSSVNNVTTYSSSGAVLAVTHFNAASVPTLIEIYPNSSAKPDEGSAATTGTVAWAAAQLTSGGQIFVHEGAYTVATTITISTAGTSLNCANPLSTTFTAGASFNSIMFKIGWAGAERQGMQVTNCGFNGANGSNTSGQSIYLRDTNTALVENNWIQFSKINAIVLDATVAGNVANRILNNNLFECGQECLLVSDAGGGNPTDSVIIGNQIGGSAIGDGTKPWVTVAELGGMQFTSNHVSGPGHTFGLNFTSGSQQDVVVANNVIETINQNALQIAGQFFSVTGNKFYNIGESGSNTYEAIYLGGSSNNTITGNTFACNSLTKYGVFSDQGALFNTVTGNIFQGCTNFSISIANAFAGGNIVGPNVYNGTGGSFSSGATHWGTNTLTLQTPTALSSVPGQLNSYGIQLSQLGTGPTPTVTTSGTAGSTTWTYVIVPKDINGSPAAASSGGSIATGNATLTGSNFNVVAWTMVSGAYSYDVYRTVVGTSPATTGLIGNVLSTASLTGNGSMFLNDTGLAGNSATAPTANSSGSIYGPQFGSETVASSATPTFSLAYGTSYMVLTANVTTFTLPAGKDGQNKTICFKQGSSAFTLAGPSNVHGLGTIGTTTSGYNCQDFVMNLANSIWLSTGPMQTNM